MALNHQRIYEFFTLDDWARWKALLCSSLVGGIAGWLSDSLLVTLLCSFVTFAFLLLRYLRKPLTIVLFLLSLTSIDAFAACGGSSPNYTAATWADLSSCVTAAVDGDTITMTGSAYTANTTITISGKGIKIVGQGSGQIMGYSLGSQTVGSGAKTFTTQSGLNITGGQTLRIQWLGDASGWPASATAGRSTHMTGTVTSYSGTTLVMNITSTGGSGTLTDWLVTSTSATVVTPNVTGNLFSITYDNDTPVDIGKFKIAEGSITGFGFSVDGSLTSVPGKFHDMWIETVGGTGLYGNSFFEFSTSRGLLWNISMDRSPFEFGTPEHIHVLATAETSSWESASTWGAADTTGRRNLYIEDFFIVNEGVATDMDNNSRTVWRHGTFYQAAWTAHGTDTSDYGIRHAEIYNVAFVEQSGGFGGYPINYWFQLRGGSLLVTDTAIPDLRPGDSKPEIHFGIYILREADSNPAGGPCWGQDQVGAQYHAPRQVGMGYVTGTDVSTDATYSGTTYNGVYIGDLDPIYFWNNTGIATPQYEINDTSDGGCTGSLDNGTDYVQSGRDFYINAGARPGYTKFTYPHPDRTDLADSTAPIAGGSGILTVSSVTTSSLILSWTKATDETSAQSALQYQVYESLSNNIDTVANAEANGIVVHAYEADIATYMVTGLGGGTTDKNYFFNVIVKDEAGNKAPYRPAEQGIVNAPRRRGMTVPLGFK